MSCVEHRGDLVSPHLVEIIGYRDLPFEKSNAAALPVGWGVERNNPNHRLTRLGDHKTLAAGRLLYESGQVRLGFVDVDGFHGSVLPMVVDLQLSLISLVPWQDQSQSSLFAGRP